MILIGLVMLFVVSVPMMFIFFFGSGASSNKESLFFFTDGDTISNAVESEKEHNGSWIDYIAAIFTIGEFDPEKIKEIDIDEVASRMSEGGYQELLGDYEEIYEEAKELLSFIYQDLISVETVIRTIVVNDDDEDANEDIEIIVEEKVTVYHGYYPIVGEHEHTIYNDYGLDTGRKDNLGNSIAADESTPIVACVSGIVTSIDDDFWGFKTINIRDDANRAWMYVDVKELAEELSVGDEVTAGSILGYFGDRDLFIKVGIYYSETEIIWINPYGILEILKENTISMDILKGGILCSLLGA